MKDLAAVVDILAAQGFEVVMKEINRIYGEAEVELQRFPYQVSYICEKRQELMWIKRIDIEDDWQSLAYVWRLIFSKDAPEGMRLREIVERIVENWNIVEEMFSDERYDQTRQALQSMSEDSSEKVGNVSGSI